MPFLHSQILGLDLQLQTPRIIGLAPLPKALRFYDPQTDSTLPSRDEVEEERDLAQQERDLAQQERNLAQQERDLAQAKAERLAKRLRDMGIEPDEL